MSGRSGSVSLPVSTPSQETAALASLVYYQFISAQTVANQALNQTSIEKRKQNTVARMVQETKPQFLDQFRRLVNNYSTARELLPGEAEVSNVLDALQQLARANHMQTVDAARLRKSGLINRANILPSIKNIISVTHE